MKLLEYNSFGVIYLNRKEITVTITAVKSDGSPITRSVKEPVGNQAKPDENLVISFGALIGEDHKSRIVFHEISDYIGDSADDFPIIGTTLAKAINLVKKSTEL